MHRSTRYTQPTRKCAKSTSLTCHLHALTSSEGSHVTTRTQFTEITCTYLIRHAKTSKNLFTNIDWHQRICLDLNLNSPINSKSNSPTSHLLAGGNRATPRLPLAHALQHSKLTRLLLAPQHAVLLHTAPHFIAARWLRLSSPMSFSYSSLANRLIPIISLNFASSHTLGQTQIMCAVFSSRDSRCTCA